MEKENKKEEEEVEKVEDQKKYFDPEQYVTQHINLDLDLNDEDEDEDNEKATPQNESKTDKLVSLLTDPKYKSVLRETYQELKNEKDAADQLLVAIAKQKDKTIQYKLVAACWESEVNFSKYLPFFILLVLSDNYLVSLEAITVISTMEGPFDSKHIEEGIERVTELKKNTTSEKQVLFNDLIEALKSFKI